MSFNTICAALAVTALGLGALAPALAKPSAHSTTFGDWNVECRAAPTKGNAKAQNCMMTQRVIDGRSGSQLLQVAIIGGEPAKFEMLTPLGTSLQQGTAIRFGEKDKAYPFSYARCQQNGCLADGPLAPDLLKALQGKEQATVLVADRSRKAIGIPVSLKGFGEALENLKRESKTDWWAELMANIQNMFAGKKSVRP